jgi:hypothetical protein
MATPGQLRRAVIVNHTIDFGDGVTVKFVYDRNKITDAWMGEWERLETERNAPLMNAMLADLILGWDVVNEDGTPFPMTEENIGYLFALPDKGRIFGELVQAAVPSRAEGNASSELSSTPQPGSTPPAPTPPNGPVPSVSPEPSTAPSLT